LSQKIYLDDCAYDKELVKRLQGAGHQVVTPAQAGTSGREDEVHFRFAVAQGLVLLTKNPGDFLKLHKADPAHAGILVIYQDNDPDRDMNTADVVRAVANLEQAGVPFRSSFHVLNAWRY
jgi:Domain of unknown function (DUF5615)